MTSPIQILQGPPQEARLSERHKILDHVDTGKILISRRDDVIIQLFYKDYTEIDVPTQMDAYYNFVELTSGKSSRFIIEVGDYCYIPKEARENAFTIQDISPMRATTVVVNNIAYKLITYFFIKFTKPKYSYKVFSSFGKAIAWLKEQTV
jgi:hypothetical protein